MPGFAILRLTWEPRMLSILRIMVGLLYMEHGLAKILAIDLGANRCGPDRSKAALLEFLATPAGAWIITTNAFEWILKALATSTIRLCLSPQPLLILSVLLGEAVPLRPLFRWYRRKG